MDWEDLQGFVGIPEWMEIAACRDHDTEAFFKEARTKEAIAVCDECEVATDCFVFAVETGSSGVWGGTTGYARDSMLESRGLGKPTKNQVQIKLT